MSIPRQSHTSTVPQNSPKNPPQQTSSKQPEPSATEPAKKTATSTSSSEQQATPVSAKTTFSAQEKMTISQQAPAQSAPNPKTTAAYRHEQASKRNEQLANTWTAILHGGRVAGIDLSNLIVSIKKANAEKILESLSSGAKQSIRHISQIPASKLPQHIQFLGEQGKLLGLSGIALGLLTGLKESIEAFQKGDTGDGFGILYKTLMGAALSGKYGKDWPGMVNNAKSFVTAIFPQLQDSPIWQVLASLDPLELGAKGIDTLVTLLKHGGDLKQLEKLVERFKKSGFGLLVKVGEWLGDQLSKKPEKIEKQPIKQQKATGLSLFGDQPSKKPEKIKKQPIKQQKATELSLEDWRKFREMNSHTGTIGR